jgi:hypothetical protein
MSSPLSALVTWNLSQITLSKYLDWASAFVSVGVPEKLEYGLGIFRLTFTAYFA